jgi:hypothetical protein
MPDRSPAPFTAWVRTHPYTAAAVPALAGLLVYLCLRQDNEWERVFVPAAARLAAGEDLYAPGGAYLYPPFTAWLTLPFTRLAHLPGRLLFTALNLAGVVLMLRWSWRLAGGGRLEGAAPAPRGEHAAALLGALCGVFYVNNCLVHQQTDVAVGVCLVGGCLALHRARPLLGATGFGLAAAMKCTALLWVPYLVWRGRPAAAAWVLVVAFGVNLLPDAVSTPASGRTWLGEFAVRHLRPLTSSNHVPGTWGSDVLYNQSLSGAGQRWLLTECPWPDAGHTAPRPRPVSPLALRGLVSGAEVLLLLAAAWACGRPFRRTAAGPADGGMPRDALEYGVVLLLMLLLSPMSSMAHFGVLILPGMCLARRAVATRGPVLAGLLGGAVLTALASNKDLLGDRLYTVALWGGCVMWNTAFLLAGCLLELRRRRAEGAGALPRSTGDTAARAA